MKPKPIVLVVEDDKDQSDLIVDIVNDTNLYQAIAAYNGEEALAELQKHQRGFNFLSNGIACILLDWQMPKMNGETFIKELRKEEGRSPFKRHIPVVILSAYSDKERLQLAKDPTLGLASGYIVKPFEETELLTLLKRIVIHKEGEILREILIERESRWVKELQR
ncbi:MAG: response regulator [Pseudohongiellaceae bacterium]|nr:response regulator [Pseudohongiellaceae bacterium]